MIQTIDQGGNADTCQECEFRGGLRRRRRGVEKCCCSTAVSSSQGSSRATGPPTGFNGRRRASMAADGHGEKLDFDVPVTVVRGDDLGRDLQAVRPDPDGVFGFRVTGAGRHVFCGVRLLLQLLLLLL